MERLVQALLPQYKQLQQLTWSSLLPLATIKLDTQNLT